MLTKSKQRMNKWSGKQNNGNIQSEQQTEREEEKSESNIWHLWDNIKCANQHIIGDIEKVTEEDQKCILINYGWKHPKSKEENRYTGTENKEGPNEPTQTHTKTYCT